MAKCQKTSGIYKIESGIKSNRCYIGSAVDIQKRWNEHLNKLRFKKHENGKLQNHYNKYGKSDLQFSIILGCEKEDLIKTEQYFLDLYNPYFNISKVAESPMLGRKHSGEARRKISEGQRGKKRSEEFKKKMSDIKRGIYCSIETRRKMSISHKNISDEARQKMSVRMKGNTISRGNIPWNKGMINIQVPWNKGKTGIYSEETIQKMKDSHSAYLLRRSLILN